MSKDLPDKSDAPGEAKPAEADAALIDYLDTLLGEIGDLSKQPQQQTAEVEAKVASANADTRIADRKAGTAPVPETEVEAAAEPVANGQAPGWAAAPFQVLLFEVNGITLGVPIGELAGILDWEETSAKLPGQPKWSMGVLNNRGSKVIVVNTSMLLMPEKEQNKQQKGRRFGGQLLLVGDGGYGLAVDRVTQTVAMTSEEIRWRKGTGLHPWFAGIMIEQLAVIVDVDGLLAELAT